MQSPSQPQGPVTIQDCLRCHCISRDPIIIIAYGNPMAPATMLAPFLADRRVYFILGNWWSYFDASLLCVTHKAYDIMRQCYPQHQYFFLTNDQEENSILDKYGMLGFFCHHNAFLDERLFRCLPGVPKDLDAIYTARLEKFKRHELARNIPSWGLLYFLPREKPRQQRAYLQRLRAMMPGMATLNHDPVTDAYRFLSPQETCRAYNRARVGLCLSSMEGGNYSTTEYMLCGLPVVSTPSKGGRAYFLDPEISRVASPSPEAVAAAVAELIALKIPPQEIRLRALLKLREQRSNFICLISSILQQEGKPAWRDEDFDRVFVHKMLTYPRSAAQFLADNGLLSA
ncbi:glycosyltransferase [Desulfovibrio sp. JY]|nr:glycosyltransferase [Desulfovibrio sp. JY]